MLINMYFKLVFSLLYLELYFFILCLIFLCFITISNIIYHIFYYSSFNFKYSCAKSIFILINEPEINIVIILF